MIQEIRYCCDRHPNVLTDEKRNLTTVRCTKCDYKTSSWLSRQDAIALWNLAKIPRYEEAKHTPGNWEVFHTPGENFIITVVEKHGNFVVQRPKIAHTYSVENEEANAYLIAAAPEMLFALELVERDDKDGGLCPETIIAVKNALEKANKK